MINVRRNFTVNLLFIILMLTIGMLTLLFAH
jgi:hypothetical protein